MVARAVAARLRPGGVLLLRDYARGDLAQRRFARAQEVEPNFFSRQDGTRSYFFSADDLRRVFVAGAGLEEMRVELENRTVENRKLGKKMDRIWITAKFKKKPG